MQHIYRHKNFAAALILATIVAIIVSVEIIESVNTTAIDGWITLAMSILFSWLIVIVVKVGIDAHRK